VGVTASASTELCALRAARFAGVYTFMLSWNESLFALLLTKTNVRTVPTPGRPTPHQFVEIYLDTGARSLQPRSQPVVRTVPAQFVAKAERGRVVIDHDQFGAGHFGQLVERLAGQGG
jgi:hypothetical protein